MTDVATVDMRTVVTIADDRLIRIWDLGRGLPEGKTTSLEFKDVKVWTPGKERKALDKKSDKNEKDDEKGQDEENEKENGDEDDDQADNRARMQIKYVF